MLCWQVFFCGKNVVDVCARPRSFSEDSETEKDLDEKELEYIVYAGDRAWSSVSKIVELLEIPKEKFYDFDKNVKEKCKDLGSKLDEFLGYFEKYIKEGVVPEIVLKIFTWIVLLAFYID